MPYTPRMDDKGVTWWSEEFWINLTIGTVSVALTVILSVIVSNALYRRQRKDDLQDLEKAKIDAEAERYSTLQLERRRAQVEPILAVLPTLAYQILDVTRVYALGSDDASEVLNRTVQTQQRFVEATLGVHDSPEVRAMCADVGSIASEYLRYLAGPRPESWRPEDLRRFVDQRFARCGRELRGWIEFGTAPAWQDVENARVLIEMADIRLAGKRHNVEVARQEAESAD